MLAGIIFPIDPVEGRLMALRFKEEMDQLKREGAFVCGNGRQFGLFLVVPKGWRKLEGLRMDPKPLETYYYFHLPTQDRMVLHTEIWTNGVVKDMVQAKSWLEAKAQLSLRWPYLELTSLQEYYLKEYHHDPA